MKGGVIVVLSALLCTLIVACWLVPSYTVGLLGYILLVDDEPRRADAIVVLLGGDSPNRILKGYELLEKGTAPRIVFGTGYRHKSVLKHVPQHVHWPPPSYAYQRALESLGVPSSKIVSVDTSGAYDTARELKVIAEYAHRRNWHHVILVSSPTHTRRVGWIWNRVSLNTTHNVVAAEEPGIDRWWRHGRLRRAVAYEYGALIKESLSQLRSLWTTIVDSLNQARQP